MAETIHRRHGKTPAWFASAPQSIESKKPNPLFYQVFSLIGDLLASNSPAATKAEPPSRAYISLSLPNRA
jgi:hypothetical protein